ncbi:BCCT family transporter [Paralimibaculum aggregatum]|uniref:BCCT family transporter n=1 Tax=Paralimibaculum aggregatum TaxID=3036245 RepID=A0ABQ6LLC4_9RHOB|nr:BCCT family transporter [Limibaculum sp. NKW23]GMG81464.1 BCCT family transporter [Limibaculum sp. NKW23]
MTETTAIDKTIPGPGQVDKPLFAITGGFIALFCALALIDIDLLSRLVDWGFNFSATWFGLYWQALLLATFLIGLVLCILPGAGTRMGALERPEFSLFQWGSMIMCTLLAGGGVFWAAGEPIAHYLSTPPLFGDLGGDPAARAHAALAQSYLHWGFLAWAILGSLTTVMLMHYHYDKGLPLAPRTLLYPVFGERAIRGPIGLIADASCIIAVVAGTVGPIGFLGLQMSYGLNALFGIPDSFATQTVVILALAGLYTISAISGLSRGIQLLSRVNVILASILLAFMLVAGPTFFIFDGFAGGMGVYLSNFLDLTMYRGEAGAFGEPGWLGWWTVFFWGWFLGYGPLMAIFIARVSRGRSIRSIILMLSIVAPIVTNFWFTIIGGTGIALEQAVPGVISGPFEGFNLPAGLLAITQALPLGFLLSLLFLVLTMIFVATTSDSMSFVIATAMSDDTPSPALRAFWGLAMGVMALILISTGAGGIGKLQSFIVVTAVPVSLVLLPSLWDALRITLALGRRA